MATMLKIYREIMTPELRFYADHIKELNQKLEDLEIKLVSQRISIDAKEGVMQSDIAHLLDRVQKLEALVKTALNK